MRDGWTEMVRSDHNPAGVDGHDVESEGVHMDLYHDGVKDHVRQSGPPMSANAGLTCAKGHLIENYEQHVRRFERWHNLNRRGGDP